MSCLNPTHSTNRARKDMISVPDAEEVVAGPEETRLRRRLFDHAKHKLLSAHVIWGPKAHLSTREELASALNRALDQWQLPHERGWVQ